MKLLGFEISRPSARNGILEDALSYFFGGGGQSASGESVTEESAMRCAAVYACVRVIAESMAQIPLPVYRRTADGGKEKVVDHAVYRLLNVAPNPWQTAFELREQLIGYLSLRGNAYAYINRVRDVPMELIPLQPSSIAVEQRLDKSLKYIFTPASGVQREVPNANILHLRGMTRNGYEGISPIEAYREAVGLALTTQKHQSSSFKNGAKFRGFLQRPKEAGKLSPEAAARMKGDFDEMHSGSNSYKTPMLEEGTTWVAAGMNSKDAETIDTQKFSRSQIASIFRVPPHMIGDLDRATFSNIEHQSIQFVSQTLVPTGKRIEGVVGRDLFNERERGEYFVEHNFDGLLRGDTLSRYQSHNLAIMSGWKNRNEVRAIENMNRVDGLDEFIKPMNMDSGTKPGDPQNEPSATTGASAR